MVLAQPMSISRIASPPADPEPSAGRDPSRF